MTFQNVSRHSQLLPLTKTPAWKDVVMVPKWGSAKILTPVMDYSGMTMFLCHIIDHEDTA
jgi:FtsP/CotA-like multicopper oxidase with cupredoxin domain